jgi:hypothetical protein
MPLAGLPFTTDFRRKKKIRKSTDSLTDVGKYVRRILDNVKRYSVRNVFNDKIYVDSKGNLAIPKDVELRRIEASKRNPARFPFDTATKMEVVNELQIALALYKTAIDNYGIGDDIFFDRLEKNKDLLKVYERTETYTKSPDVTSSLKRILLDELSKAIEATPEYNTDMLSGPLWEAFSRADAIKLEFGETAERVTKGYVRRKEVNAVVMAELVGGSLQDYANAVTATRQSLGYGDRMKDGFAASTAWFYGLYTPARLGGVVVNMNRQMTRMNRSVTKPMGNERVAQYTNMSKEAQLKHADMYWNIMRSRLEACSGKPSYWYLLNYGNVIGKKVKADDPGGSARIGGIEGDPTSLNRRNGVITGAVSRVKKTESMGSDKGGIGLPSSQPTFFVEKAEKRMNEYLRSWAQVDSSAIRKDIEADIRHDDRSIRRRDIMKRIYVNMMEVIQQLKLMPDTNTLNSGELLNILRKGLPGENQKMVVPKATDVMPLAGNAGTLGRKEPPTSTVRKPNPLVEQRRKQKLEYETELRRRTEAQAVINAVSASRVIKKIEADQFSAIDKLDILVAAAQLTTKGLDFMLDNVSEERKFFYLNKLRLAIARGDIGDENTPARVYIGSVNGVELRIRTKVLFEELSDIMDNMFVDEENKAMKDMIEALQIVISQQKQALRSARRT